MILAVVLATFLALPVPPAPATWPTASTAQDPAPAPLPDKREEVKALLAALAKHAGMRGKQDQEAVAQIDKLMQEFEHSGPKDREAIVKGLAGVFNEKRLPAEGESDEEVYRLYTAAAVALGRMGPESVKPLTDLIGDKTHRANLALQERLIASLGNTRDLGSVRLFLSLMANKENRVQGAAAKALGNYKEAELELRKSIFEELLKTLMEVRNQVVANPSDEPIRERYDSIAGPITTTLQLLSGHEESKPEEWQRWWNKNKKAEWPVE